MLKLYNNGLLISDWHIKKDERYSPSLGYRLREQPMMLLDRVEELIKELNIGWIALPGDIVDTCTCLPQESHVVRDCFVRMNSWGIPILYILGQHDVDLNIYSNEDVNYYDRSNITVINDRLENVMYVHDKYALLNDKYKVYFSNFSSPIEYPKEYVDLWVTHCSLGFVKVEEEDEKGNRKFGMMVAGDIHDHFQYGNCYTVGTPYQHKAHEQPIGVVGIVEDKGDKLQFYRKPTDTDTRKFLQFIPPPKKKIKATDAEGNEININSTSELNIMDEIYKKTKELGVDHLHNKINMADAPNPINFNFKLRKLRLKNYRSVSEAEFDFDNIGKVLLMLGSNGAGKSTIIYALRDVCFGDTASISKRVNHNAKKCEIELTLDYEGKQYTIIRGNSLFKFFINGEEQVSNNKRSLEAVMKSYLPFMEYMYLFLPAQKSSLFDPVTSVELIERCLNLDLFNYFLDQAVKLKKLFSEEANTLYNKVNLKDGELAVYHKERDSLLNTIDEYKKVVKQSGEEIEAELKKLNTYSQRINSVNTTINITSKNLSKYKLEEGVTKEDLLNTIKSLEQQKAEYDLYQEKMKEIGLAENELTAVMEEYKRTASLKKPIDHLPTETLEELQETHQKITLINDEISREIFTYDTKKKELEETIVKLNNSIKSGEYLCPTCGTLIKKDVHEFQKELELVTQELNSLVQPRELLDVVSITEKINIWNTKKLNDDLDRTLEEIVVRGKECRVKVDTLKKQYVIDNPPKMITELDIAPYRTTYDIFDRYDQDIETMRLSTQLLKTLNEELKPLLCGRTLEEMINYVNDKRTDCAMLRKYEIDLDNKIKIMKEVEADRDKLAEDYNNIKKELENWDTYINLMDYNKLDSLPYKLVDMLLTNFNNEKYMITTTNTQKNGKVKFKIDLQFRDNTNKHWISYENASGGQQMLLELFLFGSIATYVGGVGLIALDETLGVASIDVYSKVDDLVSLMDYQNILIISHSERIACYDNRLVVKLGDDGYSNYQLI